jgi:ankyrin repeat protein
LNPEFERAAITGDAPGIEAQLLRGVDIDCRDRHGQTALMLAAHNGHLQAIECLLRRGADLDVTAKYGLSALMLAVVANHEVVARALVRAGADLAIRGTGAPGFSGKTARDLAAELEMTALCSEIDARGL